MLIRDLFWNRYDSDVLYVDRKYIWLSRYRNIFGIMCYSYIPHIYLVNIINQKLLVTLKI